MAILEATDITKTFGDEVAVDGLSIEVEQGEFVSLLGPSGCGKTTTLRSIAGLEKPDSGQITLDGEVVYDSETGVMKEPEERDIGMVFQSYAVWPHMTVYENVAFPLEMVKVPKEERKSRVHDILETVDLAVHADDLATNLSGGQQQRVAIARAIVSEPKILLFDEPLASLDAKLRRELRMEIKQICNEVNISVLYVTHSQDEAMFLSDKIAVMNEGRIVEVDKPTRLHEDPQELFTMEFMGHTNILSATLASTNGSTHQIDTTIGSVKANHKQDGLQTGEDCILTIRPKFIRLNESNGESDENVYEGRIDFIAPTRDFVEYQVVLDGAEFSVRTSTAADVEIGDTVSLYFDSEDVKVWRLPQEQQTAQEYDYDLSVPAANQ